MLITRPTIDAAPVAERLRRAGIDSQIEPLLDIRFYADRCPDLDGVQALLFTSANGVRAFAAATDDRSLPVYAVGDATARAARSLGFECVESAGGDVADLASLAKTRLDPDSGRLLHVAGSAVAGDLAGALSEAGFAVERVVLYESRTAKVLSAELAAALDDGALDGVLFFSPRTAATFVNLMDQAGRRDVFKSLEAFCLSPAVKDAVTGAPWRACHVASSPTQDALLALVERAAHDDFRPAERLQ